MEAKVFYNKKNRQMSIALKKNELKKIRGLKEALRFGKIPKSLKLPELRPEDFEW